MKKPDKVDSEKVKTLEGEIQNLLVMARSRTVKPEPKWEKGVAKKQEVVGAKTRRIKSETSLWYS
ncbi:MAG: hypothetical protein HWD61_13065 [Parachlamydiaceae bacterium]|nr:MAG: hypothetical protein HWD61_13065 [Parachlamydiaceae bacterium]